ncbi:MAG TPA: dockerin type I domain-containing protein [Phycisphaerae bacterium]|nr:dockerin type I domain-containing protein [Phycisphaerae bacterium]
MRRMGLWLLIAMQAVAWTQAASAETNWEIQAVDADGLGTHPKVGADASDPSNRVVVEGIALNAPHELLDPNEMWQVFVQGEGPDMGGTAAWSGMFFQSVYWPEYPDDIQPGDRVRITGFVADNLGKANVNERHSADPNMNFDVEVLQQGVGMPAPTLISSISDCNYFDQTRAGGGEKYQARWVRMNDVYVESGIWDNHEHVYVSQGEGVNFPLHLSGQGDFDSVPGPVGDFDVVGIFDQEAGLGAWPPPDPPYITDYRIWVKSSAGIITASLMSSDPPPDGTLPKTQNNVIRLVFDEPIRFVGSGDPLVIVELDGGADVIGAFVCHVDPNDPTGSTLVASEDGVRLANQTWYNVSPSTSLAVRAFSLDVCTLAGDANGSGRVTTADYSTVKSHLGQYTDGRCDLDGSGRVTTADYGVVKASLGVRIPAKP